MDKDKLMDPIFKQLGILAALGAVIGIGKDAREGKLPGRRSSDKSSIQKFIGRVIGNATLGVMAGGIFLAFPNAPFIAVCGAACALVVIGEVVIMKYLDKYLDKKIKDN